MANISRMSVSDLHKEWKKLAQEGEELIAKRDAVLAALSEKTQSNLSKLFTAKGKPSGEVTAEIDGIKVKLEVSKKVKWDDALLREAAVLIPADKVESIISSELSIGEKTYAVLSTLLDKDSEVYKKIEAARTVTYGEPKIGFIKEK